MNMNMLLILFDAFVEDSQVRAECDRVKKLLASVEKYNDMEGIAGTCKCWLFKLVIMSPEPTQDLSADDMFKEISTHPDVKELDEDSKILREQASPTQLISVSTQIFCVFFDAIANKMKNAGVECQSSWQ